LGSKADILWIRKEVKMAEAVLEETMNTDEPQAAPQWERVECTCPDYCERDHEQD
jgi:hypothetical protein